MPRICLIDDDPGIRSSLYKTLVYRGFEVLEYPSGDHFLQDAGHLSVDLILSDINMPGTDGLQMTRRLREMGVHTPIILPSGERQNDLQAALAAGANGFLAKPFGFQGLFDQLKAQLDMP